MNIYEQMMEDDAAVSSRAVSAAVGPAPAKAAKAINLAGESGVPPSVVFLDTEGWQDQIRQQKAAALVGGSPYLQRYVASDPMAAPTSYDDMDKLDAFANASAVYSAMHKDQTAEALPKWEPPPVVEPDELARVRAEFNARTEGLKPGDEIPGAPPMVAEPPLVVPNSADEVVRRAKLLSGQRGTSGLSALPMEGAVEAFDPKGFAQGMTDLQTWLAARGLAGPMATPVIGAAGALDLTVRLTSAGLGFLSGAAENLAPGLGRDVNMLGQTLMTLAGAEYFHPAEPRVAANSKALETLGRLADESATKEMAKPLFNDFAHQLLGDQTIEIPFEALRQVYEAHGEVPHGGDGILGFIPDIAEQVARAAHTGGDVVVNLADFLTHADSKVREELAPDVRARSEDPTPNELVKAKDELEESIKEAAKKGVEEAKAEGPKAPAEPVVTQAYKAADGTVYAARKGEQHADLMTRLIEEGKVKAAEFEESGPTNWGYTYKDEPGSFNNDASKFLDAVPPSVREARAKGEAIPLPGKEPAPSLEAAAAPNFAPGSDKTIERVQAEGAPIAAVKFEGQVYVGNNHLDALTEIRHQHNFDLRLDGAFEKLDVNDFGWIENGKFVTKEGEPAPVAPAPPTAAQRVRKELFLDPLFTEPKAAGMTAEEFAIYSRNAEARALEIEDARAGVLNKLNEIQKKIDDLNRKKTAEVNLAEDAIAEGRLDDAGKHQAAAATFDRPIERLTDRLPDAIGAEDIVFSDPITKLMHDDLRVMRRQVEGEAAPPINLAEMQRWAREQVAGQTVKDVVNSITSLLRNIKARGREAYLAALKGKLPAAFKVRNEQFLNQLLGKEAINFRNEYVKTQKLITKYAKRKTLDAVDQGYTDQIHRVLAEHGVPLRRNEAELRDALGGQSLEAFVNEKLAAGRELPVADFLWSDLEKKSINDLTVEEYRWLAKSLETLDHNGREEALVTRAGQKVTHESVTGEAVDNITSVHPFRYRTKEGRTGVRHAVYVGDAWLTRPEFVIDDLDLQNPTGPLNDTVYRRLTEGRHREEQLQKDAAAQLGQLPRIKKAGSIVETPFNNPLLAPRQVPFRPTRGDFVLSAINLGNKMNEDLLVLTLMGDEISRGLDRIGGGDLGKAAVEAIRKERTAAATQKVRDFYHQTLTADEWKFVEGLWKFFADLKPEVDAMYRRLSGVAPDTVEAVPFRTPHGEVSGGYAPILHDPVLSDVPVLREGQLFDKNYFRATTANSYTKGRTGVFKPILIEGQHELLARKIREMLHDLAMREPVIDAQKILTDKRLRAAINMHYGIEYGELFAPWLEHIANRYNTEDRYFKALAGPLRIARKAMIPQVLAFNKNVILSPNLGPLITELAVHPLEVSYMLSRWPRYSRFAMENSHEIRNLMINSDRDVNAMLTSMIGLETPKQRFHAWGVRVGMYAAVKINTILAKISWYQTYRRAWQEGMFHDDAVYAADKLVRKNFGTHNRVDIAQAFRGGEFSKQWTLFGGYFNMIYNMQRDTVRLGRSGIKRIKAGDYAGGSRDMANMLANTIAFIAVPSIFGALYAPKVIETAQEDNDIVSWGKAAAQLVGGNIAGTIPGLSLIANKWIFGYDPRPHPLFQIGDLFLKTAEDALTFAMQGETSDKWVQHALQTAGYATGFPMGQLGKSGQFLWDLTTNQQSASDIFSLLRGLATGSSGEK